MKHSILSVALLCALSAPAFAGEPNVFQDCLDKTPTGLVSCGNTQLKEVDDELRKFFNLQMKAAKSDSIREAMEHADKSWYEYMEADCGWRNDEFDVLQCKIMRTAVRMVALSEEHDAGFARAGDIPEEGNAEVYETSAADLRKGYASNEVAIEKAIGEMPVKITGTVSKVRKTKNDTSSIVFESSEVMYNVHANLVADDTEKSMAISRGDTVTVLCESVNKGFGGDPEAEKCKIQ